MTRTTLRIRSGFAMLAVALAAQSASASDRFIAGDGLLKCPPGAAKSAPFDFYAAVKSTLAAAKLSPAPADARWLENTIRTDIGYQGAPPAAGSAAATANTVGSLMRANYFVAAYMLLELEKMQATEFSGSAFAQNAMDYIDISLQPMDHLPDSTVTTEGKPALENGAAAGEFLDLAAALQRVADASKDLGPLYVTRQVRFYTLSYVFGDPVGAQLARGTVCAVKFSEADRKLIDRTIQKFGITVAQRKAAVEAASKARGVPK